MFGEQAITKITNRFEDKTIKHARIIISAASSSILSLIKLHEKGRFCKLHQTVGTEGLCSCVTLQRAPMSPRVCGCAAVRQPASHKTWNDLRPLQQSGNQIGDLFSRLWNQILLLFLGSLDTCGFSIRTTKLSETSHPLVGGVIHQDNMSLCELTFIT